MVQQRTETLDHQLQQLARLEGECAQRAASEARVAELVEQMRHKVQQFELQNKANVRSAEEELSRLSDDYQRALHKQHALEARAQEGEYRIAELRRMVCELSSEAETAAARRLVHVDECVQLRQRVADERRAKDLSMRHLHDAAIEAEELHEKIRTTTLVHARLKGELELLHPTAFRLERHSAITEVVVRRAGQTLLRKGFRAFVRACARAQEERARQVNLQCCANLNRLGLAFGTWRVVASQLMGARAMSRRTDAALLASTLQRWLLCVRRFQQVRVLLCGHILRAWMAAAQRATRERYWHEGRRTRGRYFRRWRGVVHESRKMCGYHACAVRICDQQFVRVAVRQWTWAAQTRRVHRDRAAEIALRRKRRSTLRAFGALSLDKRERQLLANAGALVGQAHRHRLKATVIQAMQKFTFSRQRARLTIPRLAQASARADARRLLPKAFGSFQIFHTRLDRLRRSFAEMQRLALRQMAVVVLKAWHWAVCGQASVHAGRARLCGCRRRTALLRWRVLATDRRKAQLGSAISALLPARRAGRASGRSLGWWATWARRNRLLEFRRRTVLGRGQLALARVALNCWDDAVRATLAERCDHLSQRLEQAAQRVAVAQARRGAVEAAQRQGDQACADLANEVRRKMAEASDLWQRVDDARVRNGELLILLEKEREVVQALGGNVTQLRAECDGQAVVDDFAVRQLEDQLREALEVQGSLRFALLRSEADVERVGSQHNLASARIQELQARLDNTRNHYVMAVDSLDRKTADLTKQGWEAQQSAQRLEKVLELASFRARMCDMELQRWPS